MKRNRKALILCSAFTAGAFMTNYDGRLCAVTNRYAPDAVLAAEIETDESSGYDPGIRGDINNNNTLDVLDLIRYKRGILDDDLDFEELTYTSDIDGDGELNERDCSKLKNVLLLGEKMWTVHTLPVMDGSTSAIPLEKGIKSNVLGISYSNADKLVKHHKTHESFSRLLSGENDLIFTVPISEEQKKNAEDAGVVLKSVSVAKEGFVFIVNKQNPVDTLTQEQIRDIYSGKITNWKDVGGEDSLILPYQRNKDSGSQNYMVDFMGDTDLMIPPADLVYLSMPSLIDGVSYPEGIENATYKNIPQAIGYSVYSYAAQMYENNSNIKFIKVDGIEPSRETMADSSYPLVSYTDIMYREDADENTLEFIKWVLSEEGQKCVLDNGYVPAADMEYPEYMKPYKEKGSGKEMPENYIPSGKVSSAQKDYGVIDPFGFSLNILKDKALEDEINQTIRLLILLNLSLDNTRVSFTAVNGYGSVLISDEHDEYILNYNLINGKKIENFSDLFYKDIDFIDVVNDGVLEYIEEHYREYLQTDFLGLTGQITKFSVDSIWIENGINIARGITSLPYESVSLPRYMVTGEYYDLREVLDDSFDDIKLSYRNKLETQLLYNHNVGTEMIIKGSAFFSDEEVESRRKAYKKIKDRMKEAGKIYIVPAEIKDDVDSLYLFNVITDLFADYSYAGNKVEYTDKIIYDLYDPETGENISPSDIFFDRTQIDTREEQDFYSENDNKYPYEVYVFPDEFLAIEYPDFYNSTVRIQLPDESWETYDFDLRWVNKKYIRNI